MTYSVQFTQYLTELEQRQDSCGQRDSWPTLTTLMINQLKTFLFKAASLISAEKKARKAQLWVATDELFLFYSAAHYLFHLAFAGKPMSSQLSANCTVKFQT